MPVITALYAGLLGLMSIALAFVVGRLRGQTRISVGDGGNQDLLLAMRRQANFVQYVPMALILIAVLEMNGVTPLAIHTLGAALLVFRVCHAFGLKADTASGPGRVIGAGGTALVIAVASAWAIIVFF